MKKFLKIIFIILIMINTIAIFQNISLAKMDYTASEALKWTADSGVTNATQNVTGAIVQIIRIVGTGVAIIMITYVAIKYMSAAPSEKAEFKKSAVAYIVGALILFGTTNILNIIYTFATTNVN